MDALAPTPTILAGPTLRQRLAAYGFDAVTLLVVPAAIFSLLLFVYPFAFGFILSFEPKAGGDWLANYKRFFSDPFLYETIGKTLGLAVPVTLLNLLIAVPTNSRPRYSMVSTVTAMAFCPASPSSRSSGRMAA